MLRIPGAGDQTAPLQTIGCAEDGDDSHGEKRTRSKRKKKEAEIPEWDASAGAWRSSRKGKNRAAKIVVMWIGVGALVTSLVVGIVKFTDKKSEPHIPEAMELQDEFEDLVGTSLIVPEEELDAEVTLPKVMKKSEASFLAAAEPLAKVFLEAETIEEILPIIHEPARIQLLLQSRYPDGKIPPSGMAKFNASGQVSYKDSFAAVTILTPDYERKQLAFIDGEDGLKIDWESWIGWSEMSWPELLDTKPKKPVLVRVMAKWVDYYNFGFSDEKAWRSYRLVSPDGETTLYGYVEQNSLLDQRLRPGEPTASVAVTLKIHFREDEQSQNQVIIDSLVSDGWVVVSDTTE